MIVNIDLKKAQGHGSIPHQEGYRYEYIKETKKGFILVRDGDNKEFSVPRKAIKPVVEQKEIPYDLDEMLEEEGELLLDISPAFESAMMFYNYMDCGITRRGSRIITDKARRHGIFKIIKTLLNNSKKEMKELDKAQQFEFEQTELKELFRLAEKYNYKIEEQISYDD